VVEQSHRVGRARDARTGRRLLQRARCRLRGEEGRFYVWSRDEVVALFTADEFAVVRAHYGFDGAPNFEGRWHLRVAKSLDAVAAALALAARRKRAAAVGARQAPASARATGSTRTRRQDTDVVERAFAARACARSARLQPRRLLELAMATADFLRTELFCDGDLYATFQDGAARHRGYLDDVAFLLAALLELMQPDSAAPISTLHACLAARCSSGSKIPGGRIFLHRP